MLKLLSSTAMIALAMSLSAGFAADAVPTAEVVTKFDTRPGNPSITPDGRILVTIHPLAHPGIKMIEVEAAGKHKVYPDAATAEGPNSEFKAPLSVRTDDAGVAWILDLGTKTLHGWNTRTNARVAKITIPDSVLRPTSFLQDFALDQKRGRIIIADMTQGDLKSKAIPAFVVVDLATGQARRVAESHASMMPETENGFALNPITIDPTYDWVYFGPMHGTMLYRVPAAAFDGNGETVAAKIEAYGKKPYSDGITVDGSGQVYINDIQNMAIGVTTQAGYKIIANLPNGESWPDGISFGADGYVYATLNQLERSAALNAGKETGTGNFSLVRVKALAAGKTGR